MTTRLDLHLAFESAHLEKQDVADLRDRLIEVNNNGNRTETAYLQDSDLVFSGFPGTEQQAASIVRDTLPHGFDIVTSYGPVDPKVTGVRARYEGIKMTIHPVLGL